MRLIRFLLLFFWAVTSLEVLAQANCYETTRKLGIDLYNKGDLSAAAKKFEAAKFCPDKPANNDLDAWLGKCIVVVRLTPHELVFEAKDAEEQTVEISTNAKSFKLGTVPQWLKVTQQGKILEVSCEDNLDVSPRVAKIPVQSGGKVSYLEVTQNSADLEMEFDPESVVFSSQEEFKSVLVTTNAPEWVVDTLPSWLISDKREDTLLLFCAKNASPNYRNGEVVINASGQQFGLVVSQVPGDTVVDASRKSLVVPCEYSTDQFRVISNMPGWSVESAQQWITVVPEKETVTVMVQENQSLFSRHGSIRVNSGRRYCEIEVHQAPHVSSFTMPESELKKFMVISKDTVMVRTVPSELVVYVDDSIRQITPFPCQVDFEHHSLLVGFERKEYLFNEQQQDILIEPGLRFAHLTFTSPKNIGLRTGFVSANQFGAYFHFQTSRPVFKEQLLDTISPNGFHFLVGPVYCPIQYLGIYAGVGCGIYEGVPTGKPVGVPTFGLDYEAGLMGFFKNVSVSMGFRTSRWAPGQKSTTFVFGLGGYLKRYYDPHLGYCSSDSRRWWSLNYMTRPAQNGKGVMFSDLGKGRSRAYIKALYLRPDDAIKGMDASVGLVFTPVNGIIDMTVGVGAAVNFVGTEEKFQGVGLEMGTILNIWRIPITVMLHEWDLTGNRQLFVDFGFGFHLGEFSRSSYK